MRTFGKYQLVDRIGSGGMAEVFLAKNFGAEGLEKLLVLKRIRPEYARRPRFVSMFIDEAKIAVSLNHPNVVQVYEFGRVGSDYYLAMEYVEGVDLSQVLSAARTQRRVFPVTDAVYIVIELAKALDYAHRKRDAYGAELGIVHRDVSPQNILISRDGTVKLLDFGIARAANSLDARSREIEGKVSYMSPEQARGDAVDSRSDLFSLGVVLWEMLVGRPLFPYTTNAETLRLVKNGIIPDIRGEAPGISDGLAELVMKVLTPELEARHGSARQLQVALTRWLFEQGTVADSVSLSAFLASLGFKQRNVWLSAAMPALQRPVPSVGAPPATAGSDRTEVVLDDGGLEEDDAAADAHDELRTDSVLDGALTSSGGDGTMPSVVLPTGSGLGTGDLSLSTSVGMAGKRVERTEVVILCGDVRGFGALRANTGHERWQQALLDYIRIVEALAFKNDAVVDRVGEHGFTLLLGLPVSSENDAERAMQLAVDLMEAVEGMNLNLELPLQLSIGGMVGAVVVEHVVGEERKFDWSWDDEAGASGGLFLAESLARAAMAREVMIGGRVWRRVRRTWRADAMDSVRVEVDGDDVELASYRLLGPMSVREHLQAVKRSYHRVVGREIELRSLRRLYRDVRMTGRTQGVLLVGEHGVGKSTLVHEFIEGLRSAPGQRARVSVFQGVVDLRDKDRVYGALVGLVREVLRVGRETDMRRVLSRLESTVERLLGDQPESEREYVVHSLASLLGVKIDRNLIERLDPEHRRARIGSSLRRMIQGLAAHRPVVFTIEDIHNGDSSSLEFLAEHLGRGQKAPVLFVLTSLVVDHERCDASWMKLLGSSNLTVEPIHELEPLSARELAKGLLPEPFDQDDELVERLVERAGHKPLYLKETVELLKERGLEDTTQVRELLGGADGWLPTTVGGLMTSRLDRLPAGVKQTLRRCALLGRSFSLGLVAAMLGLAPDDPAMETVRHHLDLLTDQGFLVTDAPSSPPTQPSIQPDETDVSTDPVWSFRSAVVMEVAGRGVVEPERGELHARVADFLMDRGEHIFALDFGEVAYHLDASGETERAGEMYLLGAEQAMDSVGGDECLRLVDKALERLPRDGDRYASGLELKERALALLGKPAERQDILDELLELLQSRDDNALRVLKVRVRSARLLYDRGNLNEAEAVATEALADVRELGDKRLEGSALRLLVMVYRDTGRRELALETVREAIACFKAAGDVEGRWAALVSQGIALRQGGQTSEALASYREALSIIEGQSYRRQEQTTLINMGLLYASLGRLGKARDNYNRALSSIRDLGHIRDEGALLANMGHLYLLAGDHGRAQRYLSQSVRLARKSRDKLALADALLTLGFVLLGRERVREAEAIFKKGHRLSSEIHNVYLTAHGVLGLSEARLARGASEEALDAAREAERIGEDADLDWARAWGSSLAGLALHQMGRDEEARGASQRALGLLDTSTIAQDLEILTRHAEIVVNTHPGEAQEALSRARRLASDRLVAIGDSELRRSFLGLPLVKRLLNPPR